MSKIDNVTRLKHMRDAAIEAQGFITVCNRQTLESNRMLVFALVRAIEIIGEAAANVSSDRQERYPHIPWANIIGMRNHLIHAYFNVDLYILWNTAIIELKPLIEQPDRIILLESFFYLEKRDATCRKILREFSLGIKEDGLYYLDSDELKEIINQKHNQSHATH